MTSKELPNYIQVLVEQIIKENNFQDFFLEIKKGSQVGEGFSGELTSISISENGSDKRLDIVIKTAPTNAIRRKEFLTNETFHNESTFYTKLMPNFAKFQNEKNLPKDAQFQAYPKCYAAICNIEKEQFAIILEDLRPQGFKMWNKAKTAPIEIIHMVMRELGKFHGLSIAMKDQRPDEFAEYKKHTNLLQTFIKSPKMQGFLNGSYDRAINALTNENHKEIIRSVKNNTSSYIESCLGEKTSNRFGVMLHGDCWNNNILYRFNENGIAEDVRFLDWQVLKYCSPAIDLLYNIFTSTDKAFREKEYENLLKVYYNSLSNTVKLLGSNPDELFTLNDLKDELRICGNFAFILTPMILQVSLADSSEIANLDEMCDKSAEGQTVDVLSGLNEKAQLEYGQRLSGVIDDIINLGYYNKI